jgi:hypothetical protein
LFDLKLLNVLRFVRGPQCHKAESWYRLYMLEHLRQCNSISTMVYATIIYNSQIRIVNIKQPVICQRCLNNNNLSGALDF